MKGIRATVKLGTFSSLSDDVFPECVPILEARKVADAVDHLKSKILSTMKENAQKLTLADIQFEVINLPDISKYNE